MQYRNTHTSTGKTPSEVMFNRIVRTRLPGMSKQPSNEALQEAREKDMKERLIRKVKRDHRKTAQEKKFKPGDRVLVSQRKSIIKPTFDPKPYQVTEVKGIKGTQVTLQRGDQEKKRNLASIWFRGARWIPPQGESSQLEKRRNKGRRSYKTRRRSMLYIVFS